MKKRIVSSIMCLAMLLSLLPVSAFAATEGTVNNGNIATVGTGEDTTTVVLARMVDHSAQNPVSSEDLCSEYKITSISKDTNTVNITVSAKNVVKHENGQNMDGYWVGIGISKPADGASISQGWGTDSDSSNLTDQHGGKDGQEWVKDNTIVYTAPSDGGEEYWTYYFNASPANLTGDKHVGYITVTENGTTTTYTYKITFDVTVACPVSATATVDSKVDLAVDPATLSSGVLSADTDITVSSDEYNVTGIESVTIGETELTKGTGYNVAEIFDGKVTLKSGTNINGDIAIVATAEAKAAAGKAVNITVTPVTVGGSAQYGSVTAKVGNGSASAVTLTTGTGSVANVAKNADVILTITPPAGYQVKDFKVGGTAQAAEENGTYKITMGEADVAVTWTYEATVQEISSVAVTLQTTDLTTLDTPPMATTETKGVSLTTVWKNSNNAIVTSFASVGTYTAEITVAAKDGYELASSVNYTLNGATTTATNKVLTATANVTEPAANTPE